MNTITNASKTCLAIAISHAIANPVVASTITVNRDENNPATGCTLSEAIVTVNNTGVNQNNGCGVADGVNDVINFDYASLPTMPLATEAYDFNIGLNSDLPTITADVVIDGYLPGSSLGSISIAARGYIGFSVNNAILGMNDLNLFEAESDAPGAALRAEAGSDITLNNVSFARNVADTLGGAIFAYNTSTLTLNNSFFFSNTAGRYGGGIGAGGGASVTINNSQIRNNLSQGDKGGGGIVITDAAVSINESLITNNVARDNGGGIYIDGASSDVSLRNTDVTNNTVSTGQGGGISVSASRLTFEGGTLSGNTAMLNNGGGIFAESSAFIALSELDISGNVAFATINSNYGFANGGGISIFLAEGDISNCTIEGNTAGLRGGGIDHAGGALSVTNSTISNNESVRSRGAGIGSVLVYASDTLTLLNNTVTGNSSAYLPSFTDYAGGLFLRNYATLTMANNIFSGNSTGGGQNVDVKIGPGAPGAVLETANNLFGSATVTTAQSVQGLVLGTDDINASSDASNVAITRILGPLQDNGGATRTHALPSGSPAINVGDNVRCLDTDQRGEERPKTNSNTCDIGAFEAPGQDSFFVVPLPNGKSVIFGL